MITAISTIASVEITMTLGGGGGGTSGGGVTSRFGSTGSQRGLRRGPGSGALASATGWIAVGVVTAAPVEGIT